MAENDFFDNRKVPERGSGCLLPFIIFFAVGFIGCVSDLGKDGSLGGAVLSFFLIVFLLMKYLFPNSDKKSQIPLNYSYSPSSCDDDDPYSSEDMDDIFNEWENGDH